MQIPLLKRMVKCAAETVGVTLIKLPLGLGLLIFILRWDA